MLGLLIFILVVGYGVRKLTPVVLNTAKAHPEAALALVKFTGGLLKK